MPCLHGCGRSGSLDHSHFREGLVCPAPGVSVSHCPVSDPKSRIEGHSRLKIGSKEDHDIGDPLRHLAVKKSNVKVSRPIN